MGRDPDTDPKILILRGYCDWRGAVGMMCNAMVVGDLLESSIWQMDIPPEKRLPPYFGFSQGKGVSNLWGLMPLLFWGVGSPRRAVGVVCSGVLLVFCGWHFLAVGIFCSWHYSCLLRLKDAYFIIKIFSFPFLFEQTRGGILGGRGPKGTI